MSDVDNAALAEMHQTIGVLVMEGLLQYGRIEFSRSLIKGVGEVRRETMYHCYKALGLEERTPQVLIAGLRELLGGGGD